MLAKDHSPYRNRALEKTVEERDKARAELIARIEQVAALTADCRHWRNIAESWQQAAEVSRQPREFYTDYSERVMNAMQALKTRAEAERDRLMAENEELRGALERIADSVAIGAASKQLQARMRAIFKGIEDEARAALAKMKG